MKSDSDEYPGYLIDATNEMFREFGIEFLSYKDYKYTKQRLFAKFGDSIDFHKIDEAFKRLRDDKKFLNDFRKIRHAELESTIIYYLQNQHTIETIEKEILISGGMHPETARFILREARDSMLYERPEPVMRGITPRSLFYVIGGAAIIALNAASNLNEPTIQVSYALGGALIGRA